MLPCQLYSAVNWICIELDLKPSHMLPGKFTRSMTGGFKGRKPLVSGKRTNKQTYNPGKNDAGSLRDTPDYWFNSSLERSAWNTEASLKTPVNVLRKGYFHNDYPLPKVHSHKVPFSFRSRSCTHYFFTMGRKEEGKGSCSAERASLRSQYLHRMTSLKLDAPLTAIIPDMLVSFTSPSFSQWHSPIHERIWMLVAARVQGRVAD